MTTTTTELRAIVRALPVGTPRVRPVTLPPLQHTATSITYAVHVPLAGVLLGVRFPRAYPKGAQLLAAWWDGGADAVVSGPAPLHSARLLKYWSRGGQQLRVCVGLPGGLDVAALAADSGRRPYSILVPPDTSGTVQTSNQWEKPA